MSAAQSNGPDAPHDRPAKTLTNHATDSIANVVKFTGTDNPRHLRVIQALLTRPQPRESIDRVAGASNGPELIAELRRRGLEVPCTRTHRKDRDGFDVLPGVYHFNQQDRAKVNAWKASRQQGGAA